MNWQDYATRFETAALAAGRSQDYIKRCLAYAHGLHERGLPIIYDQEHLAELVGYDIEYLRKASNRSKLFYRFFSIPKRSGGLRRIAEPLPSLKEIQVWILKKHSLQTKSQRLRKSICAWALHPRQCEISPRPAQALDSRCRQVFRVHWLQTRLGVLSTGGVHIVCRDDANEPLLPKRPAPSRSTDKPGSFKHSDAPV